MSPREGRGKGLEAHPPAHLLKALLAAPEDITYNGVVCMRKKPFLPLVVLQWGLKTSEKSSFKLVPVGARSGWFLGKRKLSSFRLGIEIEFHCFVEWTLIWRFLPAPHPVNRTPHYMGRACFSFFFFSSSLFSPYFCPLRISLSVEWPDLSSYHPLNFYSSVDSDLVFAS